VPINSAEGFIRQVLGWREFMYWQYWQMMPDLSTLNEWQAENPVPEFFWTGQTDMGCLRHVIQGVLKTAYSHHIERPMLVSNFAILTGINPQRMLEWFRAMYIDAYDWVMQPNVIGMGMNADGGQIATKPYIASANYINKMSDYCRGCRFNHKQRSGDNACPFNLLYWNFLIEHEDELRQNPRSGRNVLGLRYLDEDEKTQIRIEATEFLRMLFQEG
jgi:deoxyribodipyrimidine photolyase-related protein